MNRFINFAIAGVTLMMVNLAFGLDAPEGAYVSGITFAGTGCPQGSIVSSTDEDQSYFSNNHIELKFDQFLIESGPTIPRWALRLHCLVNVDLIVPSGWQYTIPKFEAAGFASLSPQTQAMVKVGYRFIGQPEVLMSGSLHGPYEDNFFIVDELSTLVLWSPCGPQRSLNLRFELSLRTSQTTSNLALLDRVLLDDFQWRRCR